LLLGFYLIVKENYKWGVWDVLQENGNRSRAWLTVLLSTRGRVLGTLQKAPAVLSFGRGLVGRRPFKRPEPESLFRAFGSNDI
jgi:hypothetical protein